MSQQVKIRRDTTANLALVTPVEGEIGVDTDKKTLIVGDGTTAGGIPLAKASDIPDLNDYATVDSPTFTGTPAAPTAAPGTNTTQLATTGFVKAAIDVVLGGVSSAYDTLSEIATAIGLLAPKASPTFTGTPAAPTAATSTNTTQIATTAFVQQEIAAIPDASGSAKRNRIVNGAMQVSQENGNTSGTTNGYYGADQWATYRVTSAGTITTQRVQSVTPNGSKDRYRVTITAADSSLAAGEYLTVTQNIEGQEVADLKWGSASAKQIVVRFGFKGPQGTYAVAVHNNGAARSYVKLFTIGAGEANADTEQTVTIPGDTTGTWLTDTGIGVTLDIVLAAGSTFQTTANAWQSGNYYGTSGVSNGMGTLSSVFEIFDVGLYADPDSTGAAPTWELPSYAETLRKCQRYYYRISGTTFFGTGTVRAAGTAGYCVVRGPVTMRVPPTATLAGTTQAYVGDSSASLTALSGGAGEVLASGYTATLGSAGQSVALYLDSGATASFNSRM